MSTGQSQGGWPDLRGLHRALDDQDKAFASGDLVALPRIAERVSGLCDRIEERTQTAGQTEQEQARLLRDRAERSLRSIDAILAGHRDAQALLDSVRNPKPDATYDAEGRRLRLDPASGQLERRA